MSVFSLVKIEGDGEVSAGLVEEIEQKLKFNSFGLARALDSDSVALWQGRFAFQGGGGSQVEPVIITLYKYAGRMRIQVVGRGLDKKAVRTIEDHVIELLPVKLVSRHDGDRIQISESPAAEPGLEVLEEQIELSGI
ncbi:MAG: hypothetical protein OXG46_11130 [Chloroflexi bacterium]|nr:hypothetical protein [Chloroflexota bacterium]MCY3938029.1 hypothetical protein [Chloroflexota bacterium]